MGVWEINDEKVLGKTVADLVGRVGVWGINSKKNISIGNIYVYVVI